jgi:hypothetical protein
MSRQHLEGGIASPIMSPWLSSSLAAEHTNRLSSTHDTQRMKAHFLTALVVTAFVCGGCGTTRPDHTKSVEHNNPAERVVFSPLSSDDGKEIVEQVVRHYAMSTAARLGGKVTIFLSLGQENADPGNDLQSRLNTMVDVQVIPASRVEIVSDRWVDKQTGEAGTLLNIGRIHQETEDEVMVELIRFHPARADAPVSLIRLKRQNAGWAII